MLILIDPLYENVLIQMVQVDGSLKVKLPPLLKTAMEFVKPSVIGFVGECRRVESEYSALDMLIPLTSFCWTKNLDRKVVAVDETYVLVHLMCPC